MFICRTAVEASLRLQSLVGPDVRMEIPGLLQLEVREFLSQLQYLISPCYLRCDLFPFLFKNKLSDTGLFKLLKIELLMLLFYCFI